MNYEEYVRTQVEVHGQIKKPHKYRVGQRRAIDWFFDGVNKDSIIFDVGCGVGVGMRHLISKGFGNVYGIELNPRKVEMCWRHGLVVFEEAVLEVAFEDAKVDVFWISHSFEHMWKPKEVIQKLRSISAPNALFFFVLPYPDTGDQTAHCASEEIGLRKDDSGLSVIEWFAKNGGLVPYPIHPAYKFDDFREPEIWLKLVKHEDNHYSPHSE